ncbi:HesB/IscA family protein [Chitinophaga nivalis]|uniref:Iron-sulfur cluster assembly accessory protein n=1 Tax=Chitinophaga nivalis TaxID=2991709 RepID=A0ABT3IPZ3_9BACT|nr:iron-sulfur cluster assembly accessory protein [Chitinophaga nivalis]MCW3464292.1 iron-sulfur cluster assembly accessory protein [Chitinophaga nivalis]MCW3486017.1 iron-sulfur cluster assembly accessory protein [Chitinophaga nivalis]
METAIKPPIQLTPAAVAELTKLLQGAVEAPFLRLGVKGGGCSSGTSYMLGFDARMADDDLFDVAGIPVIIKKAHGMYLMGMEVDFQDTPDARGFIFRAPAV